MKDNKGFTLIEIVVVLVILAILAAAALPSLLGFVGESKEKVCTNHRSVIAHGYVALRVGTYGTDAYSQKSQWTDLFVRAAEKSYSLDLGDGPVVGICPEGGTYTAVFSDDGSITILCTQHKNAVTVNMTEEKKQLSAGSYIYYLLSNGIVSRTNSLDSGAVDGLRTPIINEKLKAIFSKMGVSMTENTVWYYNGKTDCFYIGTNSVAATAGKNISIDVVKYDFSDAVVLVDEAQGSIKIPELSGTEQTATLKSVPYYVKDKNGKDTTEVKYYYYIMEPADGRPK